MLRSTCPRRFQISAPAEYPTGPGWDLTSIIKSKTSLWFVFGGQTGVKWLKASGHDRSWFQVRVQSGGALTRQSLTIWSTRNRENRNYQEFMSRGRRQVVLNGRVLVPNPMKSSDVGWTVSSVLSFSWTLLTLAPTRWFVKLARRWESILLVLPSHSHTHSDEKMCAAGNGTNVCGWNVIHRSGRKRKVIFCKWRKTSVRTQKASR